LNSRTQSERIGNKFVDQLKEKGREEWNKVLGKIYERMTTLTICDLLFLLYRSYFSLAALYEIDLRGTLFIIVHTTDRY
jgi:hypothetical protein